MAKSLKIKDWSKLRKELFNGSIKQTQVDGINFKLQAMNEMGVTDIRKAAYMFATSYHETAYKMLPVTEIGSGKGRAYGTWLKNSKGEEYCWKNGNKDTAYLKKDYPFLYFGHGDVQLTWFDNYEKAGRELKVDLLRNPLLALDPVISAKIMILGMTYGWFTGRKLSTYFDEKITDYVNARRIINGTDKAAKIAEEAKIFAQALEYS